MADLWSREGALAVWEEQRSQVADVMEEDAASLELCSREAQVLVWLRMQQPQMPSGLSHPQA
jgi:hypothetical protein